MNETHRDHKSESTAFQTAMNALDQKVAPLNANAAIDRR
jgi:hypothetical protein